MATLIPSILVNPPWLSGAERPKPKTVKLEEPQAPHRMDWTSGEKARWSVELGNSLAGRDLQQHFNDDSVADAVAWLTDWLNPRNARGYDDWVHWLVAHAELELLPFLEAFAKRRPDAALSGFGPYDSVRVASLVADFHFRLESLRRPARRWLLARPETAARGLLPAAVGKKGKARAAAVFALRTLAFSGHRDAVEAAVADAASSKDVAQDEIRSALAPVLDVEALDLYPDELPEPPAFWKPDDWTRLRLTGGEELSAEAVEHLGTMLAFSTLDDPYAGLAIVRGACESVSLAAFAQDLLKAWLDDDADMKQKWALFAIAFLGDDDAARDLATALKSWPSARAKTAIGVLAAMGDDVALLQLYDLARGRKKALREAAETAMREVAIERDLDPDELTDRLIPAFDPKKDAKRLARHFESAMAQERTWTTDQFRAWIASHPRAVGVLWSSRTDEAFAAFRLDADGAALDLAGEAFELAESAEIGVVHPLHLSDDDLAAWRKALKKAKVKALFQQLDRKVYRRTDAEAKSTALDRFVGAVVPAIALLALDGRDWLRSPVLEGGVTGWWSLPLPDGAHEARLLIEPGLRVVLAPAANEDQKLSHVHLTQLGEPRYRRPKLCFGEISEVLFSEIVQDLESLRAGGK